MAFAGFPCDVQSHFAQEKPVTAHDLMKAKCPSPFVQTLHKGRARFRHLGSVISERTQFKLRSAKEYFDEHLAVNDYYAEGQTTAGEWIGNGVEMLGLKASVTREEFVALCENQNPHSGETLTQRLRTVRLEEGQKLSDRRIFYDFCISPPKSVSILALMLDQPWLVQSHREAVRLALKELESFASTRVRQEGANEDRRSGNIVAALFTHETSRALDPHLHTHCIVFNTTHDPVEKRWKALQTYEMFRAQKFAENLYYHELAKALRTRGFTIRNLPRGDFEIEGMPDEICDRFSKRHQEIDASLTRLLEQKPELGVGNLKEVREIIAVQERARKIRDIGKNELQSLWWRQVTSEERISLQQLTKQSSLQPVQPNPGSIKEAVEWAEEHFFDRHSVIGEHQIWQAALERMRGASVGSEELKQFTRDRGYVRAENDPRQITRHEVLDRELSIVLAARGGIGDCTPLGNLTAPLTEKLDAEQRTALQQLLASRDQVSVFRGGAGTGKSFVLRELVSAVQATGRPIAVLAPQRQQVMDLEAAGFPTPRTVTDFLLRADLPRHSLVVVDEAGQIGGRQMQQLLEKVTVAEGRLLLSGDTRQHGPVEASDALVAIERYSGIKPAELHSIRRQNPKLGKTREERRSIKAYRDAVAAAAAGRLAESFDRLEKMGAVIGCGLDGQSDRLAEEYLKLAESGTSTVVVSQTWSEVNRVNERIRAGLKERQLIGVVDHSVQALVENDLTRAQKRDARFYSSESIVIFNQAAQGVAVGSKAKFIGIRKKSVLFEVAGKIADIPNRQLDCVTVCRPVPLTISEGDRLHLKANRKLVSGHRVANGELVTVKSVRPDGAIELQDGRLLDGSYREFLPGYAVTSYSSQGKTVDYVLFSDSTVKTATNLQQWYVTISRGRKGLRIVTPDKAQLRENIVRSGHRLLALDIAGTLGKSTQADSMIHRFGRRIVQMIQRARFFARFNRNRKLSHERETSRMLVNRPKGARTQSRSRSRSIVHPPL